MMRVLAALTFVLSLATCAAAVSGVFAPPPDPAFLERISP